MYKCNNCGGICDEPVRERDLIGCCGDEPAYITVYSCPHCKSDEVAEAERCEVCDRYVQEHELHDGICEKCCEAVKEKFALLILRKFTRAERKALIHLDEEGDLI